MSAAKSHVTWVIWPLWATATTFGVVLGFALSFAIIAAGKLAIRGLNEDRVMGYVLAPALGIGLAVLQWLILRQHIATARWWIFATLGGWLLAYGVLQFATGSASALTAWAAQTDTTIYSVVIMLALGLSLGVVQWLVLRVHIKWASAWILASMIGFALTGAALGKSIDRNEDIVALGAIPGFITGLALFLLLQRPRAVQVVR